MTRRAWPAFLLAALLSGTPIALSAQTCALNVLSGSMTLSNGTFSYCSVSVAAGATLVIGGAVTIDCSGDVDIEGAVDGVGNGYGSVYASGGGPGKGGDGAVSVIGYSSGITITIYHGGGGGGHGGMGGGWGFGGNYGSNGGVTYDSPTQPDLMGSSGGYAATTAPGAGGAALVLSVPSGYVTLNGTVDMSGGVGVPAAGQSGSGGGSGGTLSVDAFGINGSGLVRAMGGLGGMGTLGIAGCCGGGGRVRLCASNGLEQFSGSMDVSGAQGQYLGTVCAYPGCFNEYAPSGYAGSFFDCNVTATPTPSLTPTSTPTATLTPVATETPTVTPTTTGTPIPMATSTATGTPYPTPVPGCFFVSRNRIRPALGETLEVDICTVHGGYVSLRVYNSAGELVRELFRGDLTPADHPQLFWDGRNRQGAFVASGVYLLALTYPGEEHAAKVAVIR